MKSVYQFTAESRKDTGRGSSRELRRNGIVPAIMYSKKMKPLSFTLVEKDLTREYLKGAFESKLVEISVDGKTHFALAREIQTHPVSDRIEHADFLHVDADSKIRVNVAVKVINADKCMGLKRGGAMNIVRHSIEMLCSPDTIPSRITVDVKDANIGDSIHVDSVELPKGAVPVIKRNFTLVTITGRSTKDEEATPASAVIADPKAAAKPGAAPAKAAPAKAAAKPAAKK
jgi:large subunit ribosomal protein L25